MKRFDVFKAIEYSKGFKNDSNQLLSAIAYFVTEMLTQSVVDEEEKAAPDPIIEVWEKYRFRTTPEMLRGEGFRYEMWQAITKYAEVKGKK